MFQPDLIGNYYLANLHSFCRSKVEVIGSNSKASTLCLVSVSISINCPLVIINIIIIIIKLHRCESIYHLNHQCRPSISLPNRIFATRTSVFQQHLWYRQAISLSLLVFCAYLSWINSQRSLVPKQWQLTAAVQGLFSVALVQQPTG